MKKIIVALLLFGIQITVAQEAEIKKSIATFFEGLQSADTIKIKSVCKDLILQSVSEKNGMTKLHNEPMDEFYKSIASIPKTMKIEERLLDYKIQIDGVMAHVWTPYEFYINGKLSHKGANSFQLFKEGDIWKIIYIIDTRRK
ncbi:nuclear transport factor 2 family protein [Flavobacterium suzhouense]|uniref:Nuclear transport factor 2 family protein n=1 Tax=Flavobacterium suzhouense TaxID=1529638 RepID=A0ABW5NY16_9FLAO